MADFRFGNSRRRGGVLAAFGIFTFGLGLGAIGALLLTPKTGRQLRKEVRRKYEDARDAVENLSERAGDVWERGQEWAENARRHAEPVARRFRGA
jgi:gas vesicle protein